MSDDLGLVFETGDETFPKGVQSNNYVRTTRYTLLTFIPLTLYENFQRFANIYFLILAVLGFFPFSPIAPIVQVFPLIVVLVISMLKSGIEDFMRYRSDVATNSVEFKVFQKDQASFKKVKSMDIKPGDIIMLKSGQEIPSDVVIIGVSSDDGTSYINEVNLNGETALKQKRCLFNNNQTPETFHAKINISRPSKDILKLDGSLEVGGSHFPFSIKNCYLRGTVLMHTKWACGVVLYTGHDTRIVQNQRQAPMKTSHLERRLNQLVVLDFIVNLIIIVILSGFAVKCENEMHFAFVIKYTSMWRVFAENFVAYAILMSYMIPISLYVTVEIVRFFQRWTFQLDLGMYEPELGYCVVHNSNLNEELGQIDHIFSDKTGTLTENKMELVSCSINAQKYDLRTVTPSLQINAQRGELSDLFMDIALCNSIVLTEDGISSESPDEEALVKKAEEYGIFIRSKKMDVVTIGVGIGDEEVESRYEIAAVIDFTSARKRMSVIVRNPDNSLTLYSKGADSVMFSLLSPGQNIEETQNCVDDFARMGLRTLVMAKRNISNEEFNEWKAQYDRAFIQIENREENVANAGALIEKNFELIGAVAIEDELQPDVADTIAFLSKMEINLWVLTGDKKETAVSIGKSTNVIMEGNTLVYFEFPEDKNDVKNEVKTKPTPVLIISPAALESIFDTDFLPEVAPYVRSVICYRMSPNNKARVVETMKERTNKICLAVGDGANDVSMIQAASVGVGIFGREGHQAAQNADFAITRFKHLRRLLAVHGRLSLLRISGVIIYMIAKNIVLIFPQMWFCIFTLCTPTTVYNELLLSSFNLVWTSLPPVIYGWFEQDVSPSSMMQKPRLYIEAKAGRYSSWWRIGLEMLNVTYQSVIIFLFNYYLPSMIITDEYQVGGQYLTQGQWMFTAVVFTVDIQAAIRSHHWNAYAFLGIYLSIFVLFLFSIAYGSFPNFAPEMYMIEQNLLTNFQPYFFIFISVIICLIPEALFRYLKALWFPSYSRLIREQELIAEKEEREKRNQERAQKIIDWFTDTFTIKKGDQ